MKKFTSFFIFGFLFVFLGIVSFNALIDPFDLMPFSIISGINKQEAIPQVRFQKAVEIIHKKPQGILLGSSRVMFGCSSNDLEELTGIPCCNLAFPGARMEEIYAYFQHALYHQNNLKLVVLGIDFFAFNETCPYESDFDSTLLSNNQNLWKYYWKSLATIHGITASVKTLQLFLKSHGCDKNSASNLAEKVFGTPENIETFKKRETLSLRNYFLKPNTYGNFSLSQKAIEFFHKMVAICKERNIELKVFFCPCRAIYWHGIYLKGLWPDLERLKLELVKSIPIWDFSGSTPLSSDSFTSSFISSSFFDNNHFRPKTGRELFEIIFLKQLHPFGQLINKDTCAENLKRLSIEQGNWALNHPDDIDFLKQALRF